MVETLDIWEDDAGGADDIQIDLGLAVGAGTQEEIIHILLGMDFILCNCRLFLDLPVSWIGGLLPVHSCGGDCLGTLCLWLRISAGVPFNQVQKV